MSRRGFTLAELLVFCAVVTVLSVALLPRALEPRQRMNERHAQAYLRMIASSESAWFRLTGSYRELWELSQSVPPHEGGTANMRRTLMAPVLVPYGDSIAHRGGYRFRVGRRPGGAVAGCWAWPSLRRYSGLRTFWVSFADGRVYEAGVEASWEDGPGARTPRPEVLTPVAP